MAETSWLSPPKPDRDRVRHQEVGPVDEDQIEIEPVQAGSVIPTSLQRDCRQLAVENPPFYHRHLGVEPLRQCRFVGERAKKRKDEPHGRVGDERDQERTNATERNRKDGEHSEEAPTEELTVGQDRYGHEYDREHDP